MKGSKYFTIVVAATMMIAASQAASQIELIFTPGGQNIAVGESASLSVMLDEVLEVRTIELWLSYDATIVTSLGGQPGQLFGDSGCSLFPFFDEDVPGEWYGGSVTMGPTCFTIGPGELYRWNFEGLANGVCHVQVDSLVLYDAQADIIEDVSLSDTTILVGPISTVDTPSMQGLILDLAPNPFNPRTTIRFGGRPDERVSVEVFDLSGRRLATLWEGTIGPEPGVVQWDGTDRQGRAVPGGTYLFRIFGQGDRQTTRKGLLLK